MADSRGKAINSFRCKFAPYSKQESARPPPNTPIYAPLLFFHPTFRDGARGRTQERNAAEREGASLNVRLYSSEKF